MSSTTDKAADTESLHAQIEERLRAVRTKDVDALLIHYASDVTTFDLVPPLVNRGVDGVRRRLVEWFGSFRTDIDYEIRDIDLAVSGDVAFDSHLTHVHATTIAGNTIDMWFRETIGYRKIGARWLVVHQHSSVPFDMKDGKAILSLEK